ncbi:hypothetical protein MJO29_010194 [Puccinia striiformis f. sp. tritici]|nr:hypothetical protein MJO29_010194 [Puccinia striiformis f. sp. tritici]
MDINQDERVQNLADALATLQINHQSGQDRSESIIVEINSLKLEVNSIKLSIQDVSQRLLIFHQQLANIQNTPPPPPPTQSFADVAVMTHTSFSGNPKELNKFVYFIKDRLVEVESRFQSEKSKINWIVRHFRHPNGNISDTTSSYNWWISLLKENARAQNLNPLHASAEDPYVLPCLNSLRNFLTKIEEVFADRNSVEDAKRALYSCKQGNLSLDVFNSLFSSLVYAVDLTEPSRIDIYKRAINPKILELRM